MIENLWRIQVNELIGSDGKLVLNCGFDFSDKFKDGFGRALVLVPATNG